VPALDGPALWLLPLMTAVGVLIADFASGLVHWFCDTVFEEDTPVVGPLVILPFREHHRDPLAMTRHGFLEISGNICLVLVPALLLALWLLPRPARGAPAGQLAHALLLATTFAAFWTNQLHKWAHTPAPPAAVVRLQRLRVVLPPVAHGRHHRPGGRLLRADRLMKARRRASGSPGAGAPDGGGGVPLVHAGRWRGLTGETDT
jgi:ubiquitin-conjugating enzyme E2 variant